MCQGVVGGDARQPIIALLQACRTSRYLALEIYRLDIDPIISNQGPPFWDKETIVSEGALLALRRSPVGWGSDMGEELSEVGA